MRWYLVPCSADALAVVRPVVPAPDVPCFEHRYGPTGSGDQQGGGEPGDARTDDDDIGFAVAGERCAGGRGRGLPERAA